MKPINALATARDGYKKNKMGELHNSLNNLGIIYNN
jgi:hypothetical protein